MASLMATPEASLPLLLLLLLLPLSSGLTVSTSYGPVSGSSVTAVDPRTNLSLSYSEYLMIPFAAPPLGELRFRPPRPPQPWSDPPQVPFSRVCYQAGDGLGLVPGLDSAEDCLYLSVYVPQTSIKEPLSVLVWVTGGGFVMGGGSWYGPTFLLAHENVVLVTINYRMGPFGYLTLGTDDAPGNAGLLDQRAALLWVQENIAQFGGNPSSVTLAGESAGSFSATYHLVSPGSEGLFHRVLGQSGVGGLAPGFHHWQAEQAVKFGNEISLLAGCWDLFTENRLACLREVPAVTLSLLDFENGVISQPVDDSSYASDPFFPVPVVEAWSSGHFHTGVDLLIGCNREEGLLLTQLFLLDPSALVPFINTDWDVWGPLLLLHKHALETQPEDTTLAHTILETYTGTTAQLVTTEHLTNLTDMFTDTYFMYGTHRLLSYYQDYSSGHLFTYVNSHINTIGQGNWAGIPLPGASHADELWLEFYPLIGQERHIGQEDARLSRQLTQMWTNFVVSGSPSIEGEVEWAEVSGGAGPYLALRAQPGMEDRGQNYRDRMGWWANWWP